MEDLHFSYEKTYGFECEAFGRYMTRASGSRKPRQYMSLASEMSQHGHPLVRYAAGCAAAEAAQCRIPLDRKTMYSINQRAKSLEFASQQWSVAAEGLLERFQTAQDEKIRAGYYGYSLRAVNALGNLPLMALVARMQGGDEPTAVELSSGIQTATVRQLASSKGQQHRSDLTAADLHQRQSMDIEAAGQLVLHSQFSLTKHLILPASLRDDSHPDPLMRANLIAVDTREKHRRTLMQTSDTPIIGGSQGWRSNVFTIIGMDVKLPGAEGFDTLTALGGMANGIDLRADVTEGLDVLGVGLAERFNRHVIASHGPLPQPSVE